MSIQGVRTATVAVATAGLLACLWSGCGGGGDGSAEAAKTGCQIGAPAGRLVSSPPSQWGEGPGPALVLGCLRDRRHGTVAIVSYVSGKGRTCATAYNLRSRRPGRGMCVGPEDDWTKDCYGYSGCIYGFIHEPGFTLIEGPLDPQVSALRMRIGGKTLRKGIEVTQVGASMARRLHRAAPLGYFVAIVRGCVPGDAVKIELLDEKGSSLGEGGGWTRGACPRKRSASQSLAQA